MESDDSFARGCIFGALLTLALLIVVGGGVALAQLLRSF
jgi:hypothetical protein